MHLPVQIMETLSVVHVIAMKDSWEVNVTARMMMLVTKTLMRRTVLTLMQQKQEYAVARESVTVASASAMRGNTQRR